MPLSFIKKSFTKYKGWIENGFWILLFVLAYIAMQKVMHPGWTFFGF